MKVQLSKPFFDWDSNLRPAFSPEGERVTYDWPEEIPVPDMTTILHEDGTKEVVNRFGSAVRLGVTPPSLKEVDTFSELTETTAILDPGVSKAKK